MSDLATARKKLRKLRALPKGWNYGASGRPSLQSLMGARLALQHLDALGAERFDVLPTDNFGVTIMASYKDSVAEINAQSDGSYAIFIEINDEIVLDDVDLSFGSLIDTLEAQGWQSLKSLGSHTRAFTVWSIADSPAPHSKTKAWEHLSFVRIVGQKKVDRFAPISRASIADWAASPPFSSDSPSKPLVMAQG